MYYGRTGTELVHLRHGDVLNLKSLLKSILMFDTLPSSF